ncbi:hypothetical protein Dsin_023071 [Dipteronia sinensis]|uniref:Nucleocapsid protein n=1 Tax=Dipteronia sinensis TaxID=43782 RepID=A0AAE0A481_9ROSI|nr:hypothetical protein Dsin_023071 [Dipteronia sinensis]
MNSNSNSRSLSLQKLVAMDALKQRLQKATEKSVVIAKDANPPEAQQPLSKPPTPGSNAYIFEGVKGFQRIATPGTHQPKTWNDASELPKIPIYTVSTMTSSKIVLMGQAMIENLSGSKASTDLIHMMLYLAVSLRDPGDTTKALLNAPDPAIGKRSNLAEPNAGTTVYDTKAAALRKRLAEIINKNRTGSTSAATVVANASIQPETVNAVVEYKDSIDDRASAYCYIAAYLMGLHARQSYSFIKSIKRMQERFKGWYAAGHKVIDSFELEESMANSIKQAFGRRPEVISTWVMWVAYNENETEMGKNNKGMMEYLSGQVFQYTGMHAVTLTLAVQKETKCDMAFLLRELNCPITRQAVQAIDHLLQNHELVKEKPGGKTYFRYARVWDSGYFSELQSKNCPYLVYVVAKTLKNVLPTGASSDPTQIYCIKDMGVVMKERLDGVAGKLSELLVSLNAADNESRSICDRLRS